FLEDAVASDPKVGNMRTASLGAIRHPQLAPLINAVVPGFLEETALVNNLSGQARADATTTLLSDVIVARAGSRFMLVMEDCHWLDSASWRLVSRVAQDCPQALIILTSRPTIDFQELGGLSQLPGFTQMPLSRLSPAAIESIVRDVLGDAAQPGSRRPARALSRGLIDAIAARSLGNPLFAREYALWLGASDPSSGADATLSPDPGSQSAADVPVTVQSLIASRLDALSPTEDLTLKAASVVGDRFD